jgi:hypothetical protein
MTTEPQDLNSDISVAQPQRRTPLVATTSSILLMGTIRHEQGRYCKPVGSKKLPVTSGIVGFAGLPPRLADWAHEKLSCAGAHVNTWDALKLNVYASHSSCPEPVSCR